MTGKYRTKQKGHDRTGQDRKEQERTGKDMKGQDNHRKT